MICDDSSQSEKVQTLNEMTEERYERLFFEPKRKKKNIKLLPSQFP